MCGYILCNRAWDKQPAVFEISSNIAWANTGILLLRPELEFLHLTPCVKCRECYSSNGRFMSIEFLRAEKDENIPFVFYSKILLCPSFLSGFVSGQGLLRSLSLIYIYEEL